MAYGNKTIPTNCRFLAERDFDALYRTFIEAFSDYSVPFQMTVEQFHNHLAHNGVILELCVGAFVDERMIGFSLNGFGDWRGRKTVYDAGTGVVRDARRSGAARAVFDFMVPEFTRNGWEQILLEVISTNTPAIELYQSIGFEITRRLAYFDLQKPFKPKAKPRYETVVVDNPDWNLLNRFGQGEVSWQNSTASLIRSNRKLVICAYDGGRVIGYLAFFPASGIISQIAVDEEFRGRGVASALLVAAESRLEPEKTLKASNVDDRIDDGVGFLRKLGFTEEFAQLEMVKTLGDSGF